MSRLARAILASFLLLAAGGGAALAANGAATNDTADSAQVVTAQNASVGGTLIGNHGGAYRYYRFAYPGASASVQVHLTWNPGYSNTGPAFGFNVYGPTGLYGQGIRGDDAGAASTANLTIVSPAPGDYLVQVYSYTLGSQQAFTLDFAGLGPGAAPVAGNATPESAAVVSQASPSLSGSVTGNAAGAYSFFALEYPGANTPLTISLSFTPASALPSGVFGFNLYDNAGNLAATGVEVSRSDQVAVKTATYSRMAPGAFGIQVYNYAQGVAGSYSLGVSGAATAVAAVSGNASPDRAVRLTPGASAASGTIAGNAAGSFAYYTIDYQGNDETITVSLPFSGRSLAGQGIGVNLYRGSDRVATSTVAGGAGGDSGVAYLSYSSDQAGEYMVQVFDYVPGLTTPYKLFVVGLR